MIEFIVTYLITKVFEGFGLQTNSSVVLYTNISRNAGCKMESINYRSAIVESLHTRSKVAPTWLM